MWQVNFGNITIVVGISGLIFIIHGQKPPFGNIVPEKMTNHTWIIYTPPIFLLVAEAGESVAFEQLTKLVSVV